jgi:hypothetical protein
MEQHLLAYYIGILIIFGSHLYILMYPSKPLMSMEAHSYANIFAAVLIAYYFMNKERFIAF